MKREIFFLGLFFSCVTFLFLGKHLYTWKRFCLEIIFLFFFFFFFLGTHLWHVEFPRLGLKLELQQLAYATATATLDPSRICNLHCSSQQRWIFNPLNKAGDRTHDLMYTSQVCYCWATMGTPRNYLSNEF